MQQQQPVGIGHLIYEMLKRYLPACGGRIRSNNSILSKCADC